MAKVMNGLELIRFVKDEHLKMKDKEGYVSFRYYLGVKSGQLTVPFRFMRGGDAKDFAKVTSEYTSVWGPFKTLTAATTFLPNKA